MPLSMVVWLGWSPPCGNRNGAKLREQVAESDHLVAMGAWSAGSKAFAKDAAIFAALLSEQSRIACGALVDDGGLG
jgi:2-methylisocitrate lyase-like PEP mutase family enzyme